MLSSTSCVQNQASPLYVFDLATPAPITPSTMPLDLYNAQESPNT
jgi:hypothetical protein